MNGVTYSVGDDLKWLEVSLPEYSWWFTPRIQTGLELDLSGLKSFEAIAQGDVSIATVIEAEVVLVGVSTKVSLYDLPEAQEPRTVLYVG